MLKLKSFFKKSKNFMRYHKLLIIIIVIILIPVLSLLVLAANFRDDFYIIYANSCQDNIIAPLPDETNDSVKKKICNYSAKNFFIPAKTWREWNSVVYGVGSAQVSDPLYSLNFFTYCGNGVCEPSDFSESSSCASDCLADFFLHGDGICSFGELPENYNFDIAGDFVYGSVDCKWCSSNDYLYNYSLTQNPPVSGGEPSCKTTAGITTCIYEGINGHVRVSFSDPSGAYVNNISTECGSSWPQDITTGYVGTPIEPIVNWDWYFGEH
jgi:hypothetical protein